MTELFQAIKTGYRLFDGAYDYQNEKEAGEGIKRAINEGIVKREDIFITTKLYDTASVQHESDATNFFPLRSGGTTTIARTMHCL